MGYNRTEIIMSNGEYIVDSILYAQESQYATSWNSEDWDNTWEEGPWDKESWSDDWGDSHH